MRCEPASSIITKLGGPTAVSRIADVSVHTVIRWRLAKEKGGTGGAIPHWHIQKLLLSADEIGIDLAPAEFVAAPRLPKTRGSNSGVAA